jgi:hypothetical protein
VGEAVPDRTMLEGHVAGALDIARRRCGMTQEEMVRALSPFQSRPAKRAHPQRWHDWISKPSSVSSLALIAAARLANTTVEALLAEAGASSGSEPARGESSADAIPDFDRRLREIAEVVVRLQDTVEAQAELLDRVAAQILSHET